MKKLVFFVVFFASLFFVSCTNQPVPQRVTTTTTNEKVTYSDQGFYVEQQTIFHGNTVWGISEKVYGTGLQWRDIVALNPFLNTPDRLYYNPTKKMWIVRIYPGEVLNIGGQKVYPSCTYESSTTVTTTTEPVLETSPVIPWWGWVLIVLASILGIGLLCCIFQHCFGGNSENNNTQIVRLGEGQSFNEAVLDTLPGHEIDSRQNWQWIAHRDGKRGRIKSFSVHQDVDSFDMEVKYRKFTRNKKTPNVPE